MKSGRGEKHVDKCAVVENWPGAQFHKTVNAHTVGDSG